MRVRFWDRSGFRVAQFAYLTLPVALTAAPLAHASNYVGWVLANQPDATAGYDADPQYSFNSGGHNNIIVPKGKGLYYVDLPFEFGGVNEDDDVQVSAYNTSGWCVSMGWDESQQVEVQCYDAQGTPANAAFTLLYQFRNAPFGSARTALAFALADQPSNTSSYAPSMYVSFNSTGGANMVKNTNGPGATNHGFTNYTVTFPGLTNLDGNPQVTPVYFRSRCKIVSWGVVSSATNVTVQCYDYAGVPFHSEVAVSYSTGQPPGILPGLGTLGGAWAYVENPESTNLYTPILSRQFNGFRTGHLTAQKTGTGLYTVTIPGALNYTSSTALVASTGAGNEYCNLAGWTGGNINVACYKQGGAPADSRFEVTFQTADRH